MAKRRRKKREIDPRPLLEAIFNEHLVYRSDDLSHEAMIRYKRLACEYVSLHLERLLTASESGFEELMEAEDEPFFTWASERLPGLRRYPYPLYITSTYEG
jgi:hypothetical protein